MKTANSQGLYKVRVSKRGTGTLIHAADENPLFRNFSHLKSSLTLRSLADFKGHGPHLGSNECNQHVHYEFLNDISGVESRGLGKGSRVTGQRPLAKRN